jgi:hypothetical protein
MKNEAGSGEGRDFEKGEKSVATLLICDIILFFH